MTHGAEPHGITVTVEPCAAKARVPKKPTADCVPRAAWAAAVEECARLRLERNAALEQLELVHGRNADA